jgi:hypothetical protein
MFIKYDTLTSLFMRGFGYEGLWIQIENHILYKTTTFITRVVAEGNIKLSRGHLYIYRKGATTLMKEIQGKYK